MDPKAFRWPRSKKNRKLLAVEETSDCVLGVGDCSIAANGIRCVEDRAKELREALEFHILVTRCDVEEHLTAYVAGVVAIPATASTATATLQLKIQTQSARKPQPVAATHVQPVQRVQPVQPAQLQPVQPLQHFVLQASQALRAQGWCRRCRDGPAPP